MKTLDRIKRAHVAIMGHKVWCAYSALLACGKVTVSDTCPTAFTDGWNVTYGAEFVESLNDKQLRLLVLHEATHKAYRHLHIYRDLHDENPRLANIAMDHFVNLSLIDSDAGENFIEMPPVGIKPEPKYRGWSTKQIFDDLKQNPPKQPPSGQGGERSDGGQSGGMDDHDWENASNGDPAEQNAQAREIEQALRQGEIIAKKMGKGKGNADGVFGELLRPKIDWRAVLRQFLTTTCASTGESSWSKTDRRLLAGGVYMPGSVGKTARHLVVVFDTSGSCFGSTEMGAFVSELSAIVKTVKPKQTTVLYIDWEVQGTQQFTNGRIAVQDLKPRGGGGTDMTKGFAWCRDNRIKPDAMVVLTDGYTPFGEPPGFPVLWACTTSVRAPFGLTINIEV